MKLEQQVTSLEISKRLKELGVKQESLFAYKTFFLNGVKTVDLKMSVPFDYPDYYSAFTVAELGEMLPMIYIPVRDGKKGWLWSYDGNKNYEPAEADARGKMLIYLLENNRK